MAAGAAHGSPCLANARLALNQALNKPGPLYGEPGFFCILANSMAYLALQSHINSLTLDSTMTLRILFLAALLNAGIALAQPEAIQALEERGATVGEAFDAPAGLSGYTLSFQGQPMAAYVTADGEHVLVGTLLDAEGQNLTQPILEAAANAPRPEAEWEALEQANWIIDGADDAEHIVYAFMDPNCPFCSRFYHASRDWVEAGTVQIRHIMVGVLREDSLPKSATLLSAENPAEAMAAHEESFDQGGITPRAGLQEADLQAVQSNNQLMAQLGLSGTPSVYYRDAEGDIRVIRGLPQDETLEAAMGGSAP